MSKINFKKLGEIATFINGYAFKSKDWSTQGLPIIRIQNLNNDSAPFNYFNSEIDEKYLVKKGDILISWSGSIGIYEWQSSDAVLNQHIFKVSFNKGEIDKTYFKYIVKTSLNRALQYVHGSTMKHITKKYFDQIPVPVPDIKTQKDIANILELSEKLIDKRKLQIQLLSSLAQSVFSEMFGDLKTNKFNWPIAELGEVCPFIKDGPHVSPNYTSAGVPFISVNNIIKDKWDFENVKYISEEDYEKFAKRCKPEKGDILYTKGGTTGFAKYIDIDANFINWVHLAVLKYDKTVMDGIFLTEMLNSHFCYVQSQRYTRGIANRDLVLGQMKKIKVLVPPLSKQKEFVAIIKEIKRKRVLLERSLVQLEQNFGNLMQQAFKGNLFND